jgi:hypothetical protein
MARLNYFIAPLSDAMISRTLVAHKARGFCFFINSPAESPASRTTLDLAMCLNVIDKLPGYQANKNPLIIGSDLLALSAEHWRRNLSELNLAWLHLEFSQLNSAEQFQSLKLIESILMKVRNEEAMSRIPDATVRSLEMSLASLEQALLAKDPLMSQHLRNTHSLLISYPETVHLLEDKEIELIIDAAEVHTKTEIIKAVAAKKGGGRAKVSVDSL